MNHAVILSTRWCVSAKVWLVNVHKSNHWKFKFKCLVACFCHVHWTWWNDEGWFLPDLAFLWKPNHISQFYWNLCMDIASLIRSCKFLNWIGYACCVWYHFLVRSRRIVFYVVFQCFFSFCCCFGPLPLLRPCSFAAFATFFDLPALIQKMSGPARKPQTFAELPSD